MSAAFFEIVLIIVLIVANGVFSGSEISIVSSRKVRLEQLAKRGNKGARKALKLASSPNNFLSAVQIGITLIGILSGAVGGATLASRLQGVVKQVPALAPYSEPLSIGFVVTLITYFSLVIGELVPKRIALNNPEQIACTVAKPMSGLAKLTAPIVHLLSVSTDAILNLLGIRVAEEQPVTEEEIKVLIDQGARAGLFEIEEQNMVNRVFRLGDRSVRSLMTPRPEIVWVDINDPLLDIQREILDSPYSRFPVASEDLDHCLGILSVKDLLTIHLGGNTNLREAIQTPTFVPESAPALDVLENFRETGQHLALITDEYGSIQGLVTLHDLTEAVLGNLSDQDADEPQVIRRDDGSLLLDGLLSTDELKEILQRETLPGTETGNYHTLGGLVISLFGRIPRSGEHFESKGLRFEIVDMDGNRVDKVLVTPIDKEQSEPENES